MSSKPKIKTPFAKVLPPLSADEFAALKASCKDGIRDPVLVDEDDNVLDGHHRLKIDPNAPRKVVPGLTTDAEKKAFIYQINNARRSLTPQQKKELAADQRKVALELRNQDPKKFTEKVIAAMMGVNQSTISRRISQGGTNMQTHIGSGSKPDGRHKVAPADRQKIATRVAAGEPKAKIAKDHRISPQAVAKIAGAESRKASGKGSTVESDSSSGEARQLPSSQQQVEEVSAVPAAAQHRRTEPTDIAIVMADVQSKIDCLKSCPPLFEKIEELLGDVVNVPNNVTRATNLTEFFKTTLRALKEQAAAGCVEEDPKDQPVPAELA